MVERRRAILVTFSVETRKFSGNYERNKFFRGLYGWKQIIKKHEKRYIYRRNGLLDEIPHLKIDQSMFVIAKSNLEKMRQFLEEWEDKVNYHLFDILLNEQDEMLKRWMESE